MSKCQADYHARHRGTYCRGGPPWPPVALIVFAKSDAIVFQLLVKTTGGHGGPPLQ